MTDGFRVHRDGITATFVAAEISVLQGLVGELVELLRDGEPDGTTAPPADSFAAIVGTFGSPEPPEDEVLKRLLPSAYQDDDEAAGEFRRFTEPGLRDGKVATAMTVLESFGDAEYSDRVTVTLDAKEAQAWLKTLTDLRLAIGTRIGVEQDDDGRWVSLPDDDHRKQVYGIYVWLGYLQETLVASLW